MTTAKRYGRGIFPGGQRQLNRAFGSPESAQQHFLFPFSKDACFLNEDFLATTMSTLLWTSSATGTGTAFVPTSGGGIGGTITGATGTTQDAGIGLKGPLAFSGSGNAGIEVRFKCSAVTLLEMNVGFLDAITTATATAVSSIDVPAFTTGVGDAALVCMRTSDTANKLNLLTLGSGGGAQVATALALGTLVPVLATYMTIRVQLINESGAATTSIVATIDDGVTKQYTQSAAAGQLVAATVLRPWLYFGDLTGSPATRSIVVDYIRVWGDRL